MNMRYTRYSILNTKYSGSALLLALLVLSGVVITGFTIGDLLLRDFASSRRTDEAATAFYAAESGIEQGLYQIRKTDFTLSALAGSEILDNQSRFDREATDEVPSLIFSLVQEDSFTVDMFDPDDPGLGSGVDFLILSWEDTCAGCSWVEIGYVEWMPGTGINWSENFTNVRYPASASPVKIEGLSADKAYRLRFTSHYGDVKNLTVSAFVGDPGAPTSIRHSIVTMTSIGKFGRTAQALSATFLRQAPLQKIFDFVGFTECPIVKNGAAPCP